MTFPQSFSRCRVGTHARRRRRTAPALLQASILWALALTWQSAAAQERPFLTPRAATIASGGVRVETAARFTTRRELPLSGLRGDLLEVRTAIAVGLAEGVEARVEGIAWQRMAIAALDSSAPLADQVELDGRSTSDAGDFTLAARARLWGDGDSPLAGALQVGVRLPNASNESGLGRDVTDALASLLLEARRGIVRAGAELGFAILGSPVSAASQDDQGRLGLLVEVEPEDAQFAFGVEGRTGFGDEDVGNEIVPELAGGGRLRIGRLWADLAYRRLFQKGDAAGALEGGISWTF